MVPFHSLGAAAQLKELLRGEHLICLSSVSAAATQPQGRSRAAHFQNLLTRHSERAGGKVPLAHPPLIYCLLTFQHSVNGCFVLTQEHLHLLLFEDHTTLHTKVVSLSQTSHIFGGFPTRAGCRQTSRHRDAVGAVIESESSGADQEIQSVQI